MLSHDNSTVCPYAQPQSHPHIRYGAHLRYLEPLSALWLADQSGAMLLPNEFGRVKRCQPTTATPTSCLCLALHHEQKNNYPSTSRSEPLFHELALSCRRSSDGNQKQDMCWEAESRDITNKPTLYPHPALITMIASSS